MDLNTMARLIGLGESASERQIEERVQQLRELERSVLASTQSTSHDIAIGKIAAAVKAIGERDQAQVALKAAEQQAVSKDFKDTLKAALKSSKITLGDLAPLAELCLGEEAAAAAIAAMSQVTEQKKKPLVAALCSVEIKPKALVRLKAHLAMQQPKLPDPKRQPPDDKNNRAEIQAVSEADAAAAGISIDRARELMRLRNAGDLAVGATKPKEN